MQNEEQNLNEAQTGNSIKADVTGSISLRRFGKRQMQLTSNSNFFANEIKMQLTNEALIFKVAGLDDRNTKKATLQNGTYHLMIVAELKEGKFEFDVDESDCDRAVIYCL